MRKLPVILLSLYLASQVFVQATAAPVLAQTQTVTITPSERTIPFKPTDHVQPRILIPAEQATYDGMNGKRLPLIFNSVSVGEKGAGTVLVWAAAGPGIVLKPYKYQQGFPIDMLGKMAGGRFPVINYHEKLIAEEGGCDEPLKLKQEYKLDDALGILAPEIEEESACALQKALDVAVAFLPLHPSLNFQGDYRSREIQERIQALRQQGRARALDPQLQTVRLNPRSETLYSTNDAPIYFIVSAYPDMRRFTPAFELEFKNGPYYRESPYIMPKHDQVSFYFFPVSPSGKVCKVLHTASPLIINENGKLGYGFLGFESDQDGIVGVRCDLVSYVVRLPIRITVFYDPETKKWSIYNFFESGYMPHLFLPANDIFHERQPAGDVLNALIKFYPPYRHWAAAIETGSTYVLGPQDIGVKLTPYSYAPGYSINALSTQQPKLLRYGDPFEVPAWLAKGYYIVSLAEGRDIRTWKDLYDNFFISVRTEHFDHGHVIGYSPGLSMTLTYTTSQGKRMGQVQYRTDRRFMYYQRALSSTSGKPLYDGRLYDYVNGYIYRFDYSPDGAPIACTFERVDTSEMQPLALTNSIPFFRGVSKIEAPDNNLVFEYFTSSGERIVRRVHEGMTNRFREVNIKSKDVQRRVEIQYNAPMDDILKLCAGQDVIVTKTQERLQDLIGADFNRYLLLNWSTASNVAYLFVESGLDAHRAYLLNYLQKKGYTVTSNVTREGGYILRADDKKRPFSVVLSAHDLLAPGNKVLKGTLIKVAMP